MAPYQAQDFPAPQQQPALLGPVTVGGLGRVRLSRASDLDEDRTLMGLTTWSLYFKIRIYLWHGWQTGPLTES